MSKNHHHLSRWRALRTCVVVCLTAILALTTAAPSSAGGNPAASSANGFLAAAPASPAATNETAPEDDARGLIVRYLPDAGPAVKASIRREAGMRLVEELPLINAELLQPIDAQRAGGREPFSGSAKQNHGITKANTGKKTEMAVLRLAARALAKHPQVAYAVPDRRVHPAQVQESAMYLAYAEQPYWPLQWGLHNRGQPIRGVQGTPGVDINLLGMTSFLQHAGLTGEGAANAPEVVVAVIDDGVDFSHPQLAGRMWTNSGEIPGNGVDDDQNGYIDDIHGWDFYYDKPTVHDPGEDFHGTHVAGIIAADHQNKGIAGIAPHVRIMALKFIGPEGGYISDAIRAIQYASQMGASLINASWGIEGERLDELLPLRDAIEASGLLFITAAGNQGVDIDSSPLFPAAFDSPNLISVAAVDSRGRLARFSNYGKDRVHLAAPGQDILSTFPLTPPRMVHYSRQNVTPSPSDASVSGDGESLVPDDGYRFLDGTSMSTAFVSGVAAWMSTIHQELSSYEMRRILMDSGRTLKQTIGYTSTGKMVDAASAVQQTLETRGPVRRMAGNNRYETAAILAANYYQPGVQTLLVATGETFADALAAGPAAQLLKSPVLLVNRDQIPPATRAELLRLKPREIILLGGKEAVSDSVLSQLRGFTTRYRAFRIPGTDRYDTAARLSRQLFRPGVPVVYLATGEHFPDALAASAASRHLQGPILLTARDVLPAATREELERLQPKQIILLGGEQAISRAVMAELHGLTSGTVRRIAGENRYDTAAQISATWFPPGTATVFLATGEHFPDALAAGPLTGIGKGPLLLVTPDAIPPATMNELQRLKPKQIILLGGNQAVSGTVQNQLRQWLSQ